MARSFVVRIEYTAGKLCLLWRLSIGTPSRRILEISPRTDVARQPSSVAKAAAVLGIPVSRTATTF